MKMKKENTSVSSIFKNTLEKGAEHHRRKKGSDEKVESFMMRGRDLEVEGDVNGAEKSYRAAVSLGDG